MGLAPRHGATRAAEELKLPHLTDGNLPIKQTGDTASYISFRNRDAGNNIVSNMYFGTENAAGGQVATGTAGHAGVLGNPNAYPLQFATSNAVRMTVDAAGNVGIGTTPANPLHVFGAPSGAPAAGGTASSTLVRVQDSDNVVLECGRIHAGPRTGWLRVADSTNLAWNYPLSLQPNGGSVGIGTLRPAATPDMNGTLRLAKNASAPVGCDTAHAGTPALTALYATCVCNGTSWVSAANGTSACDWGVVAATGGTVTYDGSYRIHIFAGAGSYTFTVTSATAGGSGIGVVRYRYQ